jgi:hypothetical protein
MSEEKILNGVDVEVVKGVIDAVNEKPDLAKSKFRARNEWIDGGHNRTDQAANPVEHLLNALTT